jgi:hypothetical protein
MTKRESNICNDLTLVGGHKKDLGISPNVTVKLKK